MMSSSTIVHSFEQWGAVLTSLFAPAGVANVNQEPAFRSSYDGRPLKSTSFHGKITGVRWGNTTFAELVSPVHEISSYPSNVCETSPSVKLIIQRSGQSKIFQGQRETLLKEGQFAFFESSRPYTVAYDDSSASQVLKFPKRQLHLPDRSYEECFLARFDEANPLTQTIHSLAADYSRLLDKVSIDIGKRLANNLVDLLATAVTTEVSSNSSHSTDPRASKLDQVLRYIEDNLWDCTLCPQSIAQANYLSLRALHQLFEDTENTVALTIRTMRLEKCREDLADESFAHESMTMIASRWGFSDPSHFSRTFRQMFGETPTSWRSRHTTSRG